MRTLRRAVWLAVLAAIALSAGCRSERRAPGQDDAPVTLVVAQTADPGPLNPAISTSGTMHPVTDQIFNGLVGLDAEQRPVPELAERWDVAEGGRVYTFHLRPGVEWHDGRPFTSADVAFTFERALLAFHARTRAGLEGVLSGIETPDPLTVVFRFREPYAPLLQRLDVVEASIIPRHVFDDGRELPGHPANLAPIGTGPFRFVSHTRGDRVVLERNARYFRAGAPGVDRVVFRVMPNATTGAIALERGEVDYLSSVPASDVGRLKSLDGIVVAPVSGGSGGSLCQDVLIPNLTRPPLDRLDVRRALYHALDRQFIAERVYFGQAVPSTGPISRDMTWAYSDAVREYRFDVDESNRLLDRAGFRRATDGTRFTITFTHRPDQARLAEVLRTQWRAIGVRLDLEPMEFSAAVDKVFAKKDFDLGMAPYCNGSDPDIGVRRVYVAANIGPIPFSNGAGYRNAAVDALFARAAGTIDREARRRLYVEVQRRIVDDLPYLWLVDTRMYRAWRASFSGFRPWSGGFLEQVRPAGAAP